jgi:hypothetical protein
LWVSQTHSIEQKETHLLDPSETNGVGEQHHLAHQLGSFSLSFFFVGNKRTTLCLLLLLGKLLF